MKNNYYTLYSPTNSLSVSFIACMEGILYFVEFKYCEDEEFQTMADIK